MSLTPTICCRAALPLRLRIEILLSRLMQAAASTLAGDTGDSISIEREFMDVVSRENATISRICFSYSGSAAEFDDLRQDALINIWRGMRTFRGEASHKTWIYRVTVNSCLSTIRRQSRHQYESLDGLYALIESDDPDKEAIEQIHRVIGTLGAQEKAIIMMWLDELSYDEIAEAMGMNRNTVATKIRRIKDKITKEYRKEESL